MIALDSPSSTLEYAEEVKVGLGWNQGGLKGTNLTARRKTILHDKLVELSKLIPYLE